MQLTIRRSAQQIDEHYAELRFPHNTGSAPWDIRLYYVEHQPWFEVIHNPLPAKVWGATHGSGPIVIETVHGSLLPAKPGAVSRRPNPH